LIVANPVAMDELREGAEAALQQLWKPDPPASGEAILAGRGIDLSGQMDCFSVDWRKIQARRLFSKVWHYFDRIIVEDSVAHELISQRGEGGIPKWLVEHMELLLYLREIGAEALIEFRLKPPACQLHVEQHAEEASLSRVLDAREDLARLIAEGAEIEFERNKDGWARYTMTFAEFEHTQWGALPPDQTKGRSISELRRIAARDVLHIFLAHLSSDVRATKTYRTPLGAVVPFHQRLLRIANPPAVADVAMQIKLPVIEGLPPEVLVSIRDNEQECFERFSTQLRRAIQERLKASASTDSERIAREIQEDMIAPEVNAIRSRLAAAEKVATKKSAVGIFLGVLTTTCGLLAGAIPAVAVTAGVTAAVAMTGGAASKYLDERSETSLKDMYFAWLAESHF